MTTREVLTEIRKVMSRHKGDEEELLEELVAEAEGWQMRLSELDSSEE
jgi:hypothetical protein